MAIYVNWMQLNQPIRGDAMQMEGNAASNHVVATTGVATSAAPNNCSYASVWSDDPFTVSATNLSVPVGSGYTTAWPANCPMQIPHIQPGKTTLTITTIS